MTVGTPSGGFIYVKSSAVQGEADLDDVFGGLRSHKLMQAPAALHLISSFIISPWQFFSFFKNDLLNFLLVKSYSDEIEIEQMTHP